MDDPKLTLDIFRDINWNKMVPLKVFLFVWKFMNNRLSNKDKLMMWGLLVDHGTLFLGCDKHKRLFFIFNIILLVEFDFKF